jgi:hypothetical protein
MRIVCGEPWTIDGRWVVVGEWFGDETIVFDPSTGDPFRDVRRCLEFVRNA